jgi:hypothetical protein
MIFNIFPFEGVREARFGMGPGEVRKIFGAGYKSFKKSKEDAFPTDYYEQMGVFLYYDHSAKLEAVEFALPANPQFRGIPFLHKSYVELTDTFQAETLAFSVDDDGVTLPEVGVALWFPTLKSEQTLPPESVLVHKTGSIEGQELQRA